MIVDLSHPLFHHMPAYPGDPEVSFQQTHLHARDGFCVHAFSAGTHAGTHVDAPLHFLPDGETIDTAQVLQACVGEAFMVQVTSPLDGNEIKPSHLGKVISDIRRGDRVLFATGWSAWFGHKEFFENYPGLSEELVDMLIYKKITLIGLETPSVHPVKGESLHKKLLFAGIIIVENLAYLTTIAEKRVFFSAAPLKLRGLDGSPVRAYAIIPDTST